MKHLAIILFTVSLPGLLNPCAATGQTTKVFILAGQSNMQGQGVVSMDHEEHYNGGKATWNGR